MTDPKILHLINRLSFGSSAGQIQQIEQQGIENYIQLQLKPQSIPYPSQLTQTLKSFDLVFLAPGTILQEERRIQANANQQKLDAESKRKATVKWLKNIAEQGRLARLMQSTESPRQLEEVMVDFWYNHFNVFGFKNRQTRILFPSYEQKAIRPHALGKFRQLLGATARHPAMLAYLDNFLNTAPGSPGAKGQFKGLNENYARELMELHTLGVKGGYTQQDVISLARILTGWGIPRGNQRKNDEDGFYFDEERHDFSDKVFLGKPIKGTGVAEGEEALDILASHPSTAQFISYKLAQAFVADTPPQSLVQSLAQRFLATQGDISAVLATLFSSSEFWQPQVYNAKFKTPYRYIISAMRAMGEISNFEPTMGMLQQMGMPLYGCASPDGYKNTQEAWLNPDSMIRRSSLAVPLSRGLLRKNQPVDAAVLAATLGELFSANTRQVIEKSPPGIKAALILGSPEFMKY